VRVRKIYRVVYESYTWWVHQQHKLLQHFCRVCVKILDPRIEYRQELNENIEERTNMQYKKIRIYGEIRKIATAFQLMKMK